MLQHIMKHRSREAEKHRGRSLTAACIQSFPCPWPASPMKSFFHQWLLRAGKQRGIAHVCWPQTGWWQWPCKQLGRCGHCCLWTWQQNPAPLPWWVEAVFGDAWGNLDPFASSGDQGNCWHTWGASCPCRCCCCATGNFRWWAVANNKIDTCLNSFHSFLNRQIQEMDNFHCNWFSKMSHSHWKRMSHSVLCVLQLTWLPLTKFIQGCQCSLCVLAASILSFIN